jgi:hypothetical protein
MALRSDQMACLGISDFSCHFNQLLIVVRRRVYLFVQRIEAGFDEGKLENRGPSWPVNNTGERSAKSSKTGKIAVEPIDLLLGARYRVPS